MKKSVQLSRVRLRVALILLATLVCVAGAMAAQAPATRWVIKAGGNNSDEGDAIAVDAAGNSYVTGQFASSPLNFGGANVQNHGAADMFVAKYDGAGKLAWAKGAGGSDDDWGNNIALDGAGNCYVTGGFTSTNIMFGNVSLTNAGVVNIFVAKYDNSGSLQWVRSAGGSARDAGSGVAADPSGNCYVTGYFSSGVALFGNRSLTNSAIGSKDIFLAKYDSAGNLLWVKSAGGSDDDFGNGVGVDAIGNVYATGFFYSTNAGFNGTVLTNSGPAGSSDIFIAKYDSSGTLLWLKQAGGSADDEAGGIAVDTAGNSYITGFFQSDRAGFGSVTLTNSARNGLSDIFVAKLDATGQVLWANAAGGSGLDYATGIAVDLRGNCQVAGFYRSTNFLVGSIMLTNAGASLYYDVFTAQYDRMGNLLWAQRAGGTASDFGYGVGFDAAGNSYLTGSYRGPASFGGTNLLTSNNDDIFVMRIDALPVLTLSPLANQQVLLSWPTNPPGYRLQACTNLLSTSSWSPITNSTSLIDSNNVVTNATAGDKKFFRLTKP